MAEETEQSRLGEQLNRFEQLTGADQEWLALCRTVLEEAPEKLATLLHPDSADTRALTTVSRAHLADSEDSDDAVLADEPEDSPELRAARAILSVAYALSDSAGSDAALDESIRYWRHAHLLPTVTSVVPDPLSGVAPPRGGNPDLDRVVRRLCDMGAGEPGGYTALVAMVLADAIPPAVKTIHLPVVFDRQSIGGHATLRLTVLESGPAGLYPDPALMSFLVTDSEFAASLEAAWQTGGLRENRRCVIWAIVDDDKRPCNYVVRGSLAAAFGVGLAELIRRLRRFDAVRFRRLDHSCAVTGRLDGRGNLLTVGGWPHKLEAAREKRLRVVAPAPSKPEAKPIAKGLKVRVGYAVDLPEAIPRSRSRSYRNLTIIILLVMTVTGTLIYTIRLKEQRNSAGLREAAARTATNASARVGHGDGTDLLLAMASDDIAAAAGEHTNVFASLAENTGSLVRILRPRRAGYEEIAISPDGSYALLRNWAGMVQIVHSSGQIVYERDYPPGLNNAVNQIDITAMTFAPDSRHAAIATSDRKISYIQHQADGTWAVAATLSIPIPSRKFQNRVELNKASMLSFSPDGRSLLAYGARIGSYRFSMKTPHAVPTHCPAIGSATEAQSTNSGQLMTLPHQILKVSTPSCRQSQVLAAPHGTTLQAVSQQDDGKITAITTSDAQLLSIHPGRASTLISQDGPFSQIRLQRAIDDTLHVTATNQKSTIGWSVDQNSREFAFAGVGSAVTTDDLTLWVHDGIAEIHRPSREGFHAVSSGRFPTFGLAWAGHDLVYHSRTHASVLLNAAPPPRTGAAFFSLPMPSGWNLSRLTADQQGSSAAALLEPTTSLARRTTPRQLVVWDAHSHRQLQFTQIADDSPNTITFLNHKMIVGYRSGMVRSFVLHGNIWQQQAQAMLPSSVIRLSAQPEHNTLVGLITRNLSDPPTVVSLDSRTFRINAQRQLPEPTGTPQITALRDGQFVVAYGAGSVTFLDPALNVKQTTGVELAAGAIGVYEVPGHNEVIVTGTRRSFTFDTTSHALLPNSPWGRSDIGFQANGVVLR